MHVSSLLALAGLTAASTLRGGYLAQRSEPAPLRLAADAVPELDKYIVKFKKNSTLGTAQAIVDRLDSDSTLHHEFGSSQFRGFTGQLSAAAVDALRQLDIVEFVEQDQDVVTVAEYVTQEGATWGLARMSAGADVADPASLTSYTYDDSAGEGTCVYVVDTGIFVEHDEFEGRAVWGIDTTDDEPPNFDGHGHGTHVAAIAGGRTYGGAKKTQLVGVKVLRTSGGGTLSMIAEGLDFVSTDAQTRDCPNGVVVNLSLTTAGDSTTVDDLCAAMVADGLFLVVASGNAGQPAAGYSPAREPSVFTVGASDGADAAADFSNYGPEVDILAPGVNITSAWWENTTSTYTTKGTSQAAPAVAGLAAYLMALEVGLGQAGPQAVGDRILELAHKGTLTGAEETDTVNILAFNGNPAAAAERPRRSCH